MICSRCNQEVRRVYSVASVGEDDYMPSCGCVDWDGVVALGIIVVVAAISIFIGWCVS